MSKEKATQRIGDRSGGASRQKSFLPFIIIVIVLLFLVIVGVMVFVSMGRSPEDKNIVVTPDNVEEIIANLDDSERTPIGSYEVFMNTTWHFAESSSVSEDAFVKNSENNRNTVFFTITLPDSEEEIYKSPYIPVGNTLENIALDKELSAGRYKCTLTYHLVDDSYQELSTVSVYVTIIIEN